VVVVQNAVALHQLGTATGTMTFFRALGSAFIVSGFAAIVLAGAPMIRGISANVVLVGVDAGESFRWVFAAAIGCLAVALASVLLLEERPLRGSARQADQAESSVVRGPRSKVAGVAGCLSQRPSGRCHTCSVHRPIAFMMFERHTKHD